MPMPTLTTLVSLAQDPAFGIRFACEGKNIPPPPVAPKSCQAGSTSRKRHIIMYGRSGFGAFTGKLVPL